MIGTSECKEKRQHDLTLAVSGDWHHLPLPGDWCVLWQPLFLHISPWCTQTLTPTHPIPTPGLYPTTCCVVDFLMEYALFVFSVLCVDLPRLLNFWNSEAGMVAQLVKPLSTMGDHAGPSCSTSDLAPC